MSVLNWQKSSYSVEAANCIYLAAALDSTIKIRESDEPGVVITMSPESLRALLRGVKAGEFDHLAR
ncbi:DUF397 domain-containing protein [Kitasatospora sp. NPDC091257]|uniref:DUF397 domain-containing protein n=1 Tax=Kitasatospora sp. NPDC091257 TaxID=3364084 RepID=UPI0038161830